MALKPPIRVKFADVFGHGCYAVGDVEEVRDFEAMKAGRQAQARDKDTGEPVWQVAVMDGEPGLKATQRVVSVKIISSERPVISGAGEGVPFVPVEFEDMSAVPYVHQGTGRLAWSYRARRVRALGATAARLGAPRKQDGGA